MTKFVTSRYEWIHGRKPRGNGAWAFLIAGNVVFAPGPMTYTAAKRWLKSTVSKNVKTIEVLG